jgi:hypothetical protein
MLDKRGAAHFEMIMAFLFFMGFVFFLFLTVKPYDTNILSGAVISELYDTFQEKAHTNLTSVFLKANNSEVVADCFYIELPNNLFVYGLTQSIVTNLAGSERDSEIESSSKLNIDGDDVFYKVAISPDFEEENLSSCEEVSNYYLGNLLDRKVVSHETLKTMFNRYHGGEYDALRVELGVPGTLDFAIVSEDIPDIDMQGVIPDSGDVLTRSYVTEVLYKNGTTVNAKFTLKVW